MTTKHDILMGIAQTYNGTHHDTNGDAIIAKWLNNVGCNLKTNGQYTPYCAAFVSSMLIQAGFDSKVCKSASALDIWNNTPQSMRVNKAYKGCIFVWQFPNKTHHTGFCLEPLDNNRMTSVEGNTKNPLLPDDGSSERDGGWVVSRNRTNLITTVDGIQILGFIDPYL